MIRNIALRILGYIDPLRRNVLLIDAVVAYHKNTYLPFVQDQHQPCGFP